MFLIRHGVLCNLCDCIVVREKNQTRKGKGLCMSVVVCVCVSVCVLCVHMSLFVFMVLISNCIIGKHIFWFTLVIIHFATDREKIKQEKERGCVCLVVCVCAHVCICAYGTNLKLHCRKTHFLVYFSHITLCNGRF